MTLIIDLTPSLAWSLSTLIVRGEGAVVRVDVTVTYSIPLRPP